MTHLYISLSINLSIISLIHPSLCSGVGRWEGRGICSASIANFNNYYEWNCDNYSWTTKIRFTAPPVHFNFTIPSILHPPSVNSSIHPPTNVVIHHSLFHSSIYLCIHQVIHSFDHPSILSSIIHSFNHPSILSSIVHSFIHSSLHSSIH